MDMQYTFYIKSTSSSSASLLYNSTACVSRKFFDVDYKKKKNRVTYRVNNDYNQRTRECARARERWNDDKKKQLINQIVACRRVRLFLFYSFCVEKMFLFY